MKIALCIAAAALIMFSPMAFIMSSPIGILTPVDGTTDGAVVLETAMQEVATRYEDLIEQEKSKQEYDVLDVQIDNADNWKETLALYAILQSSGAINDTGSVMMFDDVQTDALFNIYEKTHPIVVDLEVIQPTTTTTTTTTTIATAATTSGVTSPTTSATVTAAVTVSTQVVTTTTTARAQKILHIECTALPLEKIKVMYDLKQEQRDLLDALLGSEFDELWAALLQNCPAISGGTSTGGSLDVATIALSQVGVSGGEVYWRWYGFQYWVDWCACFASWCADQCGYIDSGICPKFAGVNSGGVPWFRDRGLLQSRSYVPSPGDYIFIDWEQDGTADHVEIVVAVEGTTVHTVGGNRGGGQGKCVTSTFTIGSYYIYGYGTPQYPTTNDGGKTDG